MPPNWFLHRIAFPIARVIAAVLFFVLGPLRVRGRANFPRRGGVLVLANHISDLDPPIVMYAAPRPIQFMAKSELFTMPIVGSILRFFRAFSVRRGETDRASIRLAVDALKAGEPVGVFPEGQLSEDGRLQELKAGMALIIRLSECPVICCGLRNTDKPMPYGSMVPRPGFTTMVAEWGVPRSFAKDASNEEIIHWVRTELLRLTER